MHYHTVPMNIHDAESGCFCSSAVICLLFSVVKTRHRVGLAKVSPELFKNLATSNEHSLARISQKEELVMAI